MWTNKEAYLLSKVYIDDFKTIDINNGVLNIEGFCAVKVLLRIAKQKKIKDVSYLLKCYPKLIDAIANIISNNHFFQLEYFFERIKNKDYLRACDYADMALKQVNKINDQYIKPNKNYSSSYFLRDYQKVVCSSAFRRLQDKTQLFVMDSNDYTRTRLTHSIEVSTIAEKIAYNASIQTRIEKYFDGGKNAYYDLSDCIAIAKTSGVLHDIGNPPFGHSGERNISEFFKMEEIKNALCSRGLSSNSKYYLDLCCYDGNAQSLRIATKLMSFDNKEGASLTAGVLGSIIKYPCSSKENNKKFGYFLSEEDIITDLEHLGVYKEHIKNPFVYILEAADDLAYLISDLEDAIHKKVITFKTFEHFLGKEKEDECKLFFDKLKQRFYSSKNNDNEKFDKVIKPLLFQFREDIIASIDYDFFFDAAIKLGKCEKNLLETSKYFHLFELLEEIKKTALRCKEIINREKQGRTYILGIMQKLIYPILDANINDLFVFEKYKKSSIYKIIPFNLIKTLEKEVTKPHKSNNEYVLYYKCRLLIDFVSGMTDSYAKKIYNKIKNLAT